MVIFKGGIMNIIKKSLPNKIVKTVLLFCLIFTSFFSLSTTAESQVNPDRTNGVQAATLEWIRNTALDIVSLYIARSWHGDFPDEVPSWRPTEVQDTDGRTRLDTRQRLIRWDRRPPNEILRDGFVPQVTTSDPSLNETDLYLYAKDNVKSIFVSTTKTQIRKNKKYVWTPRSAASGIVYQYEIFAPGGVDVNESLGQQSPFPEQLEIAFPGGIRPEYIRSVREMSGNRLVRIWRNPNFSDPGDLPEIASRASTEQLMWHENHPQGGNKDLFGSVTNPDSDMNGSDGKVSEDTLVYEKHDQILPDGEYKIGSRLNPNVIADLSGGAGSAVHAWNYLGLDNQKWQFTYVSEKRAYKITSSRSSNLALTWYTKSNAVAGHDYRGENSQLWRIETAKDGAYKIRSLADPKMVLDLSGSETSNGTPIVVYQDNATDNQEWIIRPMEYQLISDGEYKIGSRINPNVIAALSDRQGLVVHAWNYLGYDNQRWQFTYVSEKRAYKITSSIASDFVLTKYTGSNTVAGHDYRGRDSQLWRIETAKDGAYKIRNLANPKMVLDLTGGATLNGTLIQAFEEKKDPDNTDNQEWDISKVNAPVISDGEYKITTKINYKKVIDFDGVNYNINIMDNMNIISSYWRLEYDLEKKAYKIYTKKIQNLGLYFQNPNFMIKVDSIDGSRSKDLRCYWTIDYNRIAGGYEIRSLYDPSQVLDLSHSSTTNGNPIISCPVTNGKNQLWDFVNSSIK